MATSKPFLLAFTILFLSACMRAGAQSTFSFKNNCPVTVWPGTLTGDKDKPQLSQTGFELVPGASSSVNAPASWSGRLWARTQCQTDSTGKFVCNTADCGTGTMECKGAGAIPPASLAEFTLNGDGGKDFYDVSLVDGFNLPLSITPQGASCDSTSCPADVNAVCDPALVVKGPDGSVIACKSACSAFNTPQYCCRDEFATPDKCPPNVYSKMFKTQCPQAYSYAYDDTSSTRTCPSGANYLITFCP